MTYVDAAGLSTYYEVSGQGDPVVLLHGALSGAAFLRTAVGRRCHLVGWSDGASWQRW